MKLTTLFAATFLSFAGLNAASAGSLDNPWERNPVAAPVCTWFGVIPCHTVFDYEEPEGDEPREYTKPEREKPKSKPNKPKNKDKKNKKNKSKKRC